ncbi:MAG: hypothetical protein M3150_10770 [Pseudomonadota bacterium]|nr:hypothetical protein [Pseudomonadota bacterium]
MSDESHLPRLEREDFSQHRDKLQAWARSLDTTPERLEEVLRGDARNARELRALIGIAPGEPASH